MRNFLDEIKNAYAKLVANKTNWQIGLFEASLNNPFNFKAIKTPFITKEDIPIKNTSFVADPFLAKEDKIYIFFELKLDKGVIAVGEIENNNFKFLDIVLDEKYHLSYPNVFRIDNKWYMLPEINKSNEVRLYEAVKFPFKWKLKNVLVNKPLSDPTLFFHNGYFYLFTSKGNEELYLFYSKDFDKNYKPHPLNPISKSPRFARPAGKIEKFDKIYRFSQNCERFYGSEVNLMEIVEISPTKYKEKFIKTLLKPKAGINWNARKMHHISYLRLKDKYLIAVDAQGYQ